METPNGLAMQSRKQEFPILGARLKGDKYYTLVAKLRTAFRGWLLRRICVRKIQSGDQEFFELLPVGVRPFLPSTLPRKLAAFFGEVLHRSSLRVGLLLQRLEGSVARCPRGPLKIC